MERNARITVRGRDASYTVRGTLRETPGETRLIYEEPTALGMGGVSTELALCGGAAVLTRSGAVRCELRFCEGAPHDSVYETAHGSFPARLETHSLRIRTGARGVTVELRYTLTLGGASDTHRLKILARTEEEA